MPRAHGIDLCATRICDFSFLLFVRRHARGTRADGIGIVHGTSRNGRQRAYRKFWNNKPSWQSAHHCKIIRNSARVQPVVWGANHDNIQSHHVQRERETGLNVYGVQNVSSGGWNLSTGIFGSWIRQLDIISAIISDCHARIAGINVKTTGKNERAFLCGISRIISARKNWLL